jgi:hypothetical protein
MEQDYVAPSLEILGSLSDLTLKLRKSIGGTSDGIYLVEKDGNEVGLGNYS